MRKPTAREKDTLTPEETITYYRLSRRRFYNLYDLKLPFIVKYYDDRRLIIRTEFEKYLIEHPELRRKDVCQDITKELEEIPSTEY